MGKTRSKQEKKEETGARYFAQEKKTKAKLSRDQKKFVNDLKALLRNIGLKVWVSFPNPEDQGEVKLTSKSPLSPDSIESIRKIIGNQFPEFSPEISTEISSQPSTVLLRFSHPSEDDLEKIFSKGPKELN